MDRIYEVLKNYGLSEKEITVYREAVRHDELSPYKISKLTGIPRTTVYDVLTDLSLKGLIELEQSDGLTKQQTRIKAANPSKLRKILYKRKKKLTKLEVDIVEILPFLKQDFQKGKSNADFKFFPGIKGAKKVLLQEVLRDVDTETFVWTHQMPMDLFGSNAINKAVSTELAKRRKLNKKCKHLIPLDTWTKHVLSYQYGRNPDYIKYQQIRYIEEPFFSMPDLEIYVKGESVHIACAEKDEAWGLIVTSKALTKALKSMFNFMWNMAHPVTKELVESWGPNEFLAMQRKRKKKYD